MPFCCNCGTQVGNADRFCAKCGASQQIGQQTGPGFSRPDGSANPYQASGPNWGQHDWTGGLSPRTASLLCYIPWFGWICCIIVIASERFKRDRVEGTEVRFHAFQGLYLFVAWLIVDWIIAPIFAFSSFTTGHGWPHPFGGLLHLLILAAWIVMIIKVSQSEHYRLPIIGEMAERSVNEQRL